MTIVKKAGNRIVGSERIRVFRRIPLNEFARLTSAIVQFREERNWGQFHTAKDMAISLMLESAELAEHFQWKSESEIQEHIASHRSELGDELADVLYWVLLMAYDFGVDIEQAFLAKMEKNRKKYPVEKAQGRHTKYSDLER